MFKVRAYGYQYMSGTFATYQQALKAAHEWVYDLRLDYALIINTETENTTVTFWYGKFYDACVAADAPQFADAYVMSRAIGFDIADIYYAGGYYLTWAD